MYQCKFTAKYGAYSLEAYDLPTDNELEILEILTNRGYQVNEIYSIKKQ
jgi:hypothetical protein